MARSVRKGFTLVEMLVVIAIIGILASLLLPAVQATRAFARNRACQAQMKQIGNASLTFADVHKGRFPGWRETMSGKQVSWCVVLLPHLDQQNLYSQWQNALANGTAPPTPDADIWKCPMDLRKASGLSYIGNAGMAGLANEDYSHGIMHDHASGPVRTRLDDLVHDGQAYTVVISENVAAGHWYDVTTPNPKVSNVFVWFPSPPSPTIINAPDRNAPLQANGTTSRPSSWHQGGVNMVFCDGHTRFVKQTMSYGIYRQLMTAYGQRSDQKVIAAGLGTANPVQVLSDDMY